MPVRPIYVEKISPTSHYSQRPKMQPHPNRHLMRLALILAFSSATVAQITKCSAKVIGISGAATRSGCRTNGSLRDQP